jgi:hypothetical protein
MNEPYAVLFNENGEYIIIKRKYVYLFPELELRIVFI